MFTLLLLTPLVISALCFLCRLRGNAARALVTTVHFVGIVVLMVVALWLHIDSLSGLFLSLLGIIGFITGLYSIGYMRHEVDHGEITVGTLCNYYGFFHLFLFTMLLVVTSNNLIVMWAAIEATTLSSAFLVGIYGQRSSLEAAWKYIIICTVGVAVVCQCRQLYGGA